MAVKLRLMRMGKKKQPTYRVVVADSRSPRDGKCIDTIGTYAPRQQTDAVIIDNAKANDWLAKGAQPTDRVKKLLELSGAWQQYSESKSSASKPAKAASGKSSPSKAKAASAKKVDKALETVSTSSSDTEV